MNLEAMHSELNVLPEFTYTPRSQLRSPKRLLAAIWQGVWQGRELAWRLFVRDFSSRYRESFLGILWVIIPTLVVSVCFIALRAQGILQVRATEVSYPIYVLVGMMLWRIFTEALNAPRGAIAKAKATLSRIGFPWEALVVSALYQVVFGALVGFTVILGILFFLGVPIPLAVFWAPMTILSLILLGLAIGLVLASVGMIYEDVFQFLSLILPLWFFLTPVIYPPPLTFPFSLAVHLNPVSPLLIATRDLVTRGHVTDPIHFLIVSALSVIGFCVGLVFFRLSIPVVIRRMGA